MKKIYLIIVLSALLIIVLAVGEDQTKTLTISGIKLQVEIADSLPEQIQGLSDRDHLCADCGMLFVYDQPQMQKFVMRRMGFPLDIIFLRGGRVTEIYEDLPAPRPGETPAEASSQTPADHVLEVNAGWVRQSRLKAGDRVEY